MLVEDARVETDHFFRSESIEHAAHAIHFASNVLGSPAAGALENHVLDKVRNAIEVGGFAAGAAANPNADGNGTNVRHRLGHNDETVGEDGLLDCTRFRIHHSFYSGMTASKNHAAMNEERENNTGRL